MAATRAVTATTDRPLRIAHVAPVVERVPPVAYGGIELVVNLLVEAQVRAGREVTLFASGDSLTSAALEDARHKGCKRSWSDFVGRITTGTDLVDDRKHRS